MKTFFCAAAIVALSPLMIVGCANRSSNDATASTADPGARTYSQQDLNNSGRVQTGKALETIDPSITERAPSSQTSGR